MIKIDTTHCEYNENILTTDFTFDNTKPWTLTIGSGTGATVASSTEQHYVGNKSLKVYNPLYKTNAIEFKPTNIGDYSFTIPRSGDYRFSLRVYQQGTTWLANLNMTIKIYVDGVLTHSEPLLVGNDVSEPAFSYVYNKWQTFFNDFYFDNGVVITFAIHLENESTWTPNVHWFYLDGFKFEYIKDRTYKEPSLYSLPIN